MSDAENPIHPLPDAKTFLEGKDGIKPLQHKAEALTQFAAGFEEVPLAPTASEKLVQLGEVMKKPHWAGAHDAAHDALTGAKKLVAEGEELASHAYSVESIFNSRAPNVHTVKGVKHPILEEALKPLTTYLEEFGALITGWAGLSPSRMKAKEADTAITPAQHRTNTPPPAAEARPPLTILPMPPEEGGGHVHGPGCNHQHEPLIPPIIPEATPTDGHVHGAGCNHDHPTPPPSSSGSGHVHGPGCGHDHAPSSSSGGGVHYHGDTPCSHSHAPSGSTHEPHLPKGKSNAGWWVAGIVAAVGVGAYLINEYGKPDKKKEDAPKPKDWKARVEPAASSEARTL